ncbi:hypothetical protein ACTFIR_002925 [Dictyostelium discoideum]
MGFRFLGDNEIPEEFFENLLSKKDCVSNLEYTHVNNNEDALVSYDPFVANTISYSCSSSFTAIKMACESILSGRSDSSIAGGVNSWFDQEYLNRIFAAGAISKNGRCRTFEEQADGYCRAEGAGVVFLKKLSSAIRDGDKIYSVIKSISSNNDGCVPDKPKSVNHCDNVLKNLYGYSVWENQKSLVNDEINQPSHAQPLIFLVHYGLIELYKSWGIVPDAVLGRSAGDFSAIYLAGMNVIISKDEFINRFSNSPFYNEIEIGCYNAKNSIVIVSTQDNLEIIKQTLSSQSIFAAFLGSKCPFHSSKQLIVKPDFDDINQIGSTNKPTIKYYSTVTSKEWDNENDKFDSTYLFNNNTLPVLFNQTLNNLLNDQELMPKKNAIIVEVSPQPTLTYYLKDFKDQFDLTIINPLSRKTNDIEQINESISQFYHFKNNSYKWITDHLPNYAWDDVECWFEYEQHAQSRVEGPPVDSLGLKNVYAGNVVYQTIINLRKDAFNHLKDHKVGDDIYYPGVGYLHAVLKFYKGKEIKVEYLNCISQFVLNENSTYTLQLVITKLTKKNDYFQFFKRENITHSRWVEVCNGKTSTNPFKSVERKLPIDDLISKCNFTTVKKQDLYSTISEHLNINYGKNFQIHDEAMLGDKMSVSSFQNLKKLSEFQDDDEIFSIPILDSMFHGALILDLDKTGKKCVFERIEQLRYFYNSIPKSRDTKIYYVASLGKKLENSIYFNIKACLADGTLLFDCVGVGNFQNYKDRIKIKNPKNQTYTAQWQLKDSPLLDPIEFKMEKVTKPIFKGYENPTALYNYTSYKYIKSFEKHNINISKEEIFKLSIDELIEKYHENKGSLPSKNLFTKVFTNIKTYRELLNDEILNNNEFDPLKYLDNYYDYKEVFSKLPFDGIDLQIGELFNSKLTPEQLESVKADKFKLVTENDISTFLYRTSLEHLHEEFCRTIRKMFEPLLFKRITFRLIEFGGGTCGLAYYIIREINNLLEENPLHLIDIHYTFSDISPSFLPDAKKLLDQFNKSLVKQGLNQSSYDMVLLQYVLHAVKNVEFSTNEIYNILNPSGHLMLYEASKHDILIDSLFSNFKQWNHFEDNRSKLCCLDADEWFNLFRKIGFKIDNSAACSKDINERSPQSFLMISQKPSITQLSSQLINKTMETSNSNSIQIINEIDEIKDLESKNNLIVFLKGIDGNLNENNFEEYNINLTNCLQWIMNYNLYDSFKFILFTLNAQLESNNYLQSSLFGVVKYFLIHPELICYSIDLDEQSLNNTSTFNNIHYLTNTDSIIEKYFSIRNSNQISIEKVHIENNKRIITESFEKENLVVTLNKKLKYDLTPRLIQIFNIVKLKLKSNQVVVGKNVENVKEGDHVYGYCFSSHVITRDYDCFLKPKNLTFEEASTIPVVYGTSFYSLFQIKKIKDGDAVLIHSAAGGIGLSALNLLKSKNFKGIIFTTIGNEEKKQYLIDHYGKEFINGGIFSSRDNDYVYGIRKYFEENNISKDGCDFILNTLSGDYMSDNISICGTNGAIVDLSVTHIIKNELLDYSSYGLNHLYAQVELLNNVPLTKKSMKKLNIGFENSKIDLTPFTCYSIENADQLFDEMAKRKNIGKLVINSNNQVFEKQIKDNYYDTIKENKYLGSTVLITGQRGLALHTAKWITKYTTNVKDIIIFSRSPLSWEMELLIKKNNNKINYHYRQLDIGNSDQVKDSINEIYSTNNSIKPVGSIFHYAFCLSDAPTKKVSIDNFIEAHNAKSHGAINLHNLSLQLNHLHRKTLNLPALVIKWDGIENSYVTRKTEKTKTNFNDYKNLSVQTVLGALDLSLQSQNLFTEFLILKNKSNMKQINKSYLNHFDQIYDSGHNKGGARKQVDELSIKDNIVLKISNLLQIVKEKLNLNIKLLDYGADSLLMIQFKNWIELQYVPISLEKLQNTSINDIILYISSK